jgi:hypothetical protein
LESETYQYEGEQMTKQPMEIEDLDQEEMVVLVGDMFFRILAHYAFWFNEVRHQLGSEKAMAILPEASKRSVGLQLQRVGKLLGFEVKDGLPAALWEMPRERLLEILKALSLNWLANDGVWFQAVEFTYGMNDAKRCNDSCWAGLSPLEADAVRRILALPERPGLAGLKQALGFRLYSRVNKQSIVDEKPDSFVFQMNVCRVQATRLRKGLDDYPCKSAGLVEYTYFARCIDPRIETECVGCPPDDHPAEWFCAWRFNLKESE